jgi:hypothetical protein
MSHPPTPADPAGGKRRRRMRPEVVRQRAAQRRAQELQALFEAPVDELSPDDLARMKAAFLGG